MWDSQDAIRPERPQSRDKHLSHPWTNANRTCAVTELPTQQNTEWKNARKWYNGLSVFLHKTWLHTTWVHGFMNFWTRAIYAALSFRILSSRESWWHHCLCRRIQFLWWKLQHNNGTYFVLHTMRHTVNNMYYCSKVWGSVRFVR